MSAINPVPPEPSRVAIVSGLEHRTPDIECPSAEPVFNVVAVDGQAPVVPELSADRRGTTKAAEIKLARRRSIGLAHDAAAELPVHRTWQDPGEEAWPFPSRHHRPRPADVRMALTTLVTIRAPWTVTSRIRTIRAAEGRRYGMKA